MSDGWRRLHPLTPIVRGGRVTIAVVVVIVPSLVAGRRGGTDGLVQLGILALVVVAGLVNWLVTRWRVDGDDLQIETGLVRRRSVRFPLAQVQAIDVVRPGLARLFGVGELRLRMGGSSGGLARLAYLADREVEPLRTRLLALAHGAPVEDEVSPGLRRMVEERLVARVPTGRLVWSILISDVGVFAELVIVAIVVVAFVSPGAAVGLVSGGLVWIFSIVTLVWRRFNQEYNLSVTARPEGLHLRGGLVALTEETIRPGRVQAVRMVEPFFWRRLGWCRLEVDLAGRQRAKGEGQEARRALRAVLPVGRREQADALLDRLLPARPTELAPPPPRVRWKSPLRYRMLAWGHTDDCVQTRSGRLRRVTCWVPLEKAQSLRRVQGPLQRRLGLASVHVDTAGRSVRAVLRDRDEAEADGALVDLAALARAARA
ncbi:MAG TPA: PH domain-containing protein [Gaiellaceae bacterium]|nr:PH domain-containing protein [Gaiellaceae bacterium]